jgi:hypothetical protein
VVNTLSGQDQPSVNQLIAEILRKLRQVVDGPFLLSGRLSFSGKLSAAVIRSSSRDVTRLPYS